MELSSVLGESSANGPDVAPTPTAKDADHALLEICKEMSATLQRLELHLTTRAQAARTSAIPNPNIVDAATRDQQNSTPDLVSGHNERDIPKIVGAAAREQQEPVMEIFSGHNEEESLSHNQIFKATSYVRETSPALPEIPPPPTVYYRGGINHLQRVAKESRLHELRITRSFDERRDVHREVVDDIPQSITSVDWKYYVPLFDKNSWVGERVGRGGGRTDFGWKWNLISEDDRRPELILGSEDDLRPKWETSLAHFVPYSHMLPQDKRILNLFGQDQHAVFRSRLGGLYTVPSDQRLAFTFQPFELQQQSWESAEQSVSEFLSVMTTLRDIGGSFTIRDYEDSEKSMEALSIECRIALYGYNGGILKSTAQDAEEFFIKIPPIRLDNATGTSPWRRLIVCEGFARIKKGLFWVSRMNHHISSIPLYMYNGRRTWAELDHTSSRNLFHINWFVLESAWDDQDEDLDQDDTNMTHKPIRRHGTLYGSEGKKISVTSFTIQAIPFRTSFDPRGPIQIYHDQHMFERINSCDFMYWTILVLAPIWHDPARQYRQPMFNFRSINIGTLHVTMLSGIKNGLSGAVESWIEIGDYLEQLLGGEDIFLDPEAHDQFCFYDHNDLSQSKKCFWIINSVDNFDKSIQDTLYQWEWFYQTHIKYLSYKAEVPQLELLDEFRIDIDLLHKKLKAQSERFLSIQKEARELRDGLFGASNLINAKESVKEAKNSAHLGETVKLLTLVTIFFLPLGYITSLWAIVTVPDLKIFASVSVGTALATYLAVLAVVKWENISTAWVTSRNRITSSWKYVNKGPKSEKNEAKTGDNGDRDGQRKPRFANLRSRLRHSRKENHDGVDDAYQP